MEKGEEEKKHSCREAFGVPFCRAGAERTAVDPVRSSVCSRHPEALMGTAISLEAKSLHSRVLFYSHS